MIGKQHIDDPPVILNDGLRKALLAAWGLYIHEAKLGVKDFRKQEGYQKRPKGER